MKLGSNTIWNKKLPSLLGLFFLVFAIGTISYLSRNAILSGTKAATGNVPKDVRISNITDTTFTVSYTTDATVLGSISFGTLGKMDQVALDDRDKPKATPTEHTIHYITVANLAPSTAYTFSITSGDKSFINNEAAYQVTTAPSLTSPSISKTTTSGKITQENGTPASETLVYLSSNNSQLLSTITNSSGGYTFDLQNLRSGNLKSLVELLPETTLVLQIENATNQSRASILTSQANAVPLIILSKNYDFAVSTQPLSPSPTATDSAELSETPSVSPVAFPTNGENIEKSPNIISPEKDQSFKDQQPLFKGSAVPNETVTITINSEQTITATVTSDKNGNWQYRPNEPLDPGTHTITIRTIDASGIMKVITQSFIVYADGSQFTEPSVSPSTSPTNTPTPTQSTPSITVTPTPKATQTPAPTTKAVSPTPIKAVSTLSPTTTATSTPTNQPTQATSVTTPPIPVTGNTTVMITVIGVVTTIAIGALLFIFTTV